MAEAMAYQREAQTMAEAFWREDPADPKRISGRAVAASKLGTTLLRLGDVQGALRNFRLAIAANEEAAKSGTDPRYRRNLAIAHQLLGDALRDADALAKPEEIKRQYQTAIAIFEEVSAQDEKNAQTWVDQISAFTRIGGYYPQLERYPEARGYVE